jgi:hypothetical protein
MSMKKFNSSFRSHAVRNTIISYAIPALGLLIIGLVLIIRWLRH